MKNIFFKTILCLVFLVLFDGLFLLFEDMRACPASVLVAVGGVNVSYLALLSVGLFVPRRRGFTVLSGALYARGIGYFATSLIVGIVLICWPADTVFWPVVIQSVLLGLFVVLTLSGVLANDATVRSVETQRRQGDVVRDWAETVTMALRNVDCDDVLRRQLRLCRDELKMSPLDNTDDTAYIEAEISNAVAMLSGCASTGDMEAAGDMVSRVRRLVEERNYKLRKKQNY